MTRVKKDICIPEGSIVFDNHWYLTVYILGKMYVLITLWQGYLVRPVYPNPDENIQKVDTLGPSLEQTLGHLVFSNQGFNITWLTYHVSSGIPVTPGSATLLTTTSRRVCSVGRQRREPNNMRRIAVQSCA
ncbi:hypothetical protein EV424DRAFT_1343825 [Suillus variegatus]|nr:hypothetical protein EV424DRAFT_1343825 [Suillus variegatus]